MTLCNQFLSTLKSIAEELHTETLDFDSGASHKILASRKDNLPL